MAGINKDRVKTMRSWGKDFKIYRPAVASSTEWLQVVQAWLFQCGTDAHLDSLGSESAPPVSH